MSNRRLLLSLADAGGRLMYSGKDLAELSGYTGRVYSLLSSLHALDNDMYTENARPATKVNDEVRRVVGSRADRQTFYDMSNIQGHVVIGANHLLIKNVPIVAPAGGAAGAERGGEELVKSLNLRVAEGQHTLITGPK